MSSSSSPPSVETNATSCTSTPMAPAAPPVCSPEKKVLNLPSGYHFHPTDDELVVHYLRPRLAKADCRLPLPIFIRERILNYHPDVLIEKYRNYGEDRWFFFTERERKHLGGNRPNRTTPDNGHWNATGSVKAIRSPGGVLVGCRRTLVFYEASRSRKKKNQAAAGLPPPMAEEEEEEEEGEGGQAAKAGKDDDDVKTDWTMYEYESLASEAEFQALRNGNANKMDKLVLCTIQKKKNCISQEGGETKKSTKRKTKEEALELEDVPDGGTGGGGSRAGRTEVGHDEDHHVQRALMEAAAAAKAEPYGEEQAYHVPAAGVDNFNNFDPNQSMPYYYLANSLSPVPTPSQETLMMAPASGDNNQIVMQQSYYFINHSMNSMKNSQSFHVQETPPQELLLPYLDTNKMLVPRGGGNNTMDHMLQNRFVNMMPSQALPSVSVSGISTYVSPTMRSKSNVWEEHSEELLYGDKQPNMPLKSEEEDWWISHHQAEMQLPLRELDNNPYDYDFTNSLSFVPAPEQQTVTAIVAREYNHAVMHQRSYLNHSSYMWDSQLHVQATLPPQEEFLACSSTKMAGGSTVDHHMLQNRIVNNVMPAAAEAHTFSSFFPSLSTSNYGHLSTRIDDHPGPSSVLFPSQQSHGAGSRIGPLLNNQVNLNHQNSASASMVGYDQSNGASV